MTISMMMSGRRAPNVVRLSEEKDERVMRVMKTRTKKFIVSVDVLNAPTNR
jgi:hypothetical protein